MSTIQKRSNNTYTITVSLGYGADGKQIRRTKTIEADSKLTPKQIEKYVQQEAALFEAECRQGLVLNGNIKLQDFIENEWLPHKKRELKIRTYKRYTEMLPRIYSALGHLRLDRIRPQHLMSFYEQLSEQGVRLDVKYRCKINLAEYRKKRAMSRAELARQTDISASTLAAIEQGKNCSEENAKKLCAFLGEQLNDLFDSQKTDATLSPKTILHHHRLLSSALTDAVMWGHILNNPCNRVRPPRVKKTEPRFLDEVEAKRLFELLEEERIDFKTAIRVLVLTGCRRGELLGLHWSDVDFEQSLISFKENLLYTPETGIYLDTTKTDSSTRVIKVSQMVINDLRKYKVWQMERQLVMGDRWTDTGFVFTNFETGKPLNPDSFSKKFIDFIKAHQDDLPYVSVHSMRHTNATLMISSHVAITTVATRLGHANTSTTAKIYAHAIKSADEAAAETLEDLLNPNDSTNTA